MYSSSQPRLLHWYLYMAPLWLSIVSRFPSDLMKSTVVDESLSSYKPMYCSREYQASTRLIQQYEKSTLNYTSRIWDRGQALT